jgi:hypothetical protein
MTDDPSPEWFTPEERDQILRNVGMALLSVQLAERILDLALLHVFRARPVTLEELERFRSAEYRAGTLGALIKKLKRHADLDPNFDTQVLQPYLEARNEFVHRLTIGPGKSFRTNEGKANALHLAFNLFCGSVQVIEAMGVALRRWLDAEAPDPETVAEITELMDRLKGDGPLARAFDKAIAPRRPKEG